MLAALFHQYCPQISHEKGQVFYSTFSNALEKNLNLKNEIKQLLHIAYQNTFINYESFAEMFLLKQPDNEPLVLHQDWSYAEEDKTLTATVWLPLQKTTKENGALFLIPGSHKFFHNYRSGSLPSARIPLHENLQKHQVTIEVNEGEAIIFHPALFHGSHPNTSNENRIVAAAIVTTSEQPLLYFHQPQNTNLLHTYPLTEANFLEQLQGLSRGETLSGVKAISSSIYHHQNINAEQLYEVIERQKEYAV